MAEHRSMQRGALLDAARSLLSEGGTDALTFPALAERTGLARSSVYEYFRSRAAVVEELCAVDFPVWAAEIEAAMEAARTPEDKIEAYVRSQLGLVDDRRHRAVVAISASELDAGAREKIRAAHGGLVAMIVEALGALGQAEPRLAAMLLQGVVDAAVRRIELGAAEDPAVVTETAVAMALRGVRGDRPPSDRPQSDRPQGDRP
ncbi:TetR/AcrR family transcriptional regulator [Streptomyces sp. NPDC048551]|uniref:TetR/AcrR family transcriptional regulator n=1 Tax=Streptomyces sp. NPDC048551 TaxID=3155758 RepID=UPI00342C21A6